MAVKFGKFELPKTIKVENPEGDNKHRVVAEPFERGLGHTIGNALRRVLLTSLESPAILSFMMSDVSHEYMTVEGVLEDIPYVAMHFKSALLRYLPMSDDPTSRKISKISKHLVITNDMLGSDGYYKVKLGDFFEGSEYEVVNPDLTIFTATKPLEKTVVLKVGMGRGYVPSEASFVKDKERDEILLDAHFSPIKLVNYFVENCRVGGETDMDRLVMEIETDNRIDVQEAIGFAVQILTMHFSIFNNLSFESIVYEEEDEEEETMEKDSIVNKLSLTINEIELSVRSTNCLIQANITKMSELVVMTEADMLKFRNFGKKSLNEIKEKLEEMNLSLGMDLSKYNLDEKDTTKNLNNAPSKEI